MRWSDLEPRDVLQITNEYLSYCGEDFQRRYKNKDLIISEIIYEKDYIKINIDYYNFNYINYNGIISSCGIGCSKFKLVKLKDEQ